MYIFMATFFYLPVEALSDFRGMSAYLSKIPFLRVTALKTSQILTQGNLQSWLLLKLLGFIQCNKPTCHGDQVWLVQFRCFLRLKNMI